MKKTQIQHDIQFNSNALIPIKTKNKEQTGCLQNPAWQVFIIGERGCEAYWLYSAICNNPAWQGYWGYGFIGAGLMVGAVNELGLRKYKPKAYKITNVLFEQSVIASVIIGYLQDFVSETSIPWAIAADAGIIIFMSAGALWHLNLKRRLYSQYSCDSKIYTALGRTINFLYDGLLGAGIAYYGQDLATNFNYVTSPIWAYSTQAASGLVYAACNTMAVDSDIFQNPSRARLGMLIYACANLAFNTISYSFDFAYIAFQILMDSFGAYEASKGKEDYVSDAQFYLSLSIAFSILLLSSSYYGFQCKQDIEYPEEMSDEEESAPEQTKLLHEVAQDVDNDYDSEDEISERIAKPIINQKNMTESKNTCCTPFWSKIASYVTRTTNAPNHDTVQYRRN